VLPALVLDGFGRLQHVHLSSQRLEERILVHEHGMSYAGRTCAARGSVHPFHGLPGRGRLEHVHMRMERLEE